MSQRILAATYGSNLSTKAVKAAQDLAALCVAELVALKVVPRYPQTYFEGGIAFAPQDVMASHGRKCIMRVLLGSETQHVLTHAAIQVLILK